MNRTRSLCRHEKYYASTHRAGMSGAGTIVQKGRLNHSKSHPSQLGSQAVQSSKNKFIQQGPNRRGNQCKANAQDSQGRASRGGSGKYTPTAAQIDIKGEAGRWRGSPIPGQDDRADQWMEMEQQFLQPMKYTALWQEWGKCPGFGNPSQRRGTSMEKKPGDRESTQWQRPAPAG